MKIINQRRLRDYPRIMLAGMAATLLLNFLLRHGWVGAAGQVIGTDFIALYGAGLLYRNDIRTLYDFAAQLNVQKSLAQLSTLEGANYFAYPPHAALMYSVFTFLPLIWAFAAWVVLTLLFVALSVYWMDHFLTPGWLAETGLTRWQLLIVVLSFFPFVEGFQVGQNSSLTFLLITGAVVFSLSGRWFIAGMLIGLTIYKPQFCVGFLIVWAMWQRYSALGGFAVVAGVLVGGVILQHGIAPYKTYLDIVPPLLLYDFPYQEGYASFLQVTPFGLLTTALPRQLLPGIIWLTYGLAGVFSAGLAWIAYRLSRRAMHDRMLVLMLAILYPLVVAPHTLLHDLLLLVPFFLLWAQRERSRQVLYAAIGVYFGALLLPWPSHQLGIAFLSLIPLSLLAMQLRRIWVGRRELLGIG